MGLHIAYQATMSSAAVTNFSLNFDENVRWAMCLRLKPDVLAAIRGAGPDASHIRFATEGGKHVRRRRNSDVCKLYAEAFA